LLPLLDAIPPVRGRIGHPRRKSDSLFADRGYDHDIYRDQVRARGIVPAIARRGTPHGTGLGTYRWVVWPHGFRRLRIRWETVSRYPRSVTQTRLLPHHPPTTQLAVLTVASAVALARMRHQPRSARVLS